MLILKKGNRSLAEMENNHIHDDLLYVNAHINNISFPNTIEELENFIFENGMYNVENILYDETVIWTVPRSSKIGDVVLFFHAKTANEYLYPLKLRAQLRLLSS